MTEQLIQQNKNDEIDLIEILLTLWKGKWKIVLTLLIFLVLGLSTFFLMPKPFVSSVEFKPINSSQAKSYILFNSLGTYQVGRNELRDIYMEMLQDKTIFEAAFDQYQLLDKSQFKTSEDYVEARNELINTIDIRKKIKEKERGKEEKNGENVNPWQLIFEYNHLAKWKQVLMSIDQEITEQTRQEVIRRFQLTMDKLALQRKRQLEVLDNQIKNVLNSKRLKIMNRLAFLDEQAAIARKLNIKRNTIDTQSFNTSNGVVTTLKTKVPFYLRGYDAIEKEIELMKSRKDISLFLDDLVDLKQKKSELLQDDSIKLSEQFFKQTPVFTNDGFRAVQSIDYLTKTKYKYSLSIIVLLLLVLGGVVGMLWVLILNSVKKRK